MLSGENMITRRRMGFVLVATLLTLTTGCVGLVANLVHVAKGNMVPPAFEGLKGRRVAVVCVSNSQAFGPTSASIVLARQVGKLIQQNVKEVSIIEPQKVADWIDEHDWDYVDYVAVGRGVDAEMVLAIDLDGFSLHDGKTLYKGRADVQLVVYDLTEQGGGKEVFALVPPQIQYPKNLGMHTTDISESAFRRKFLNVVARHIAKQFYSYDMQEEFAEDTTIIGT